MNNKFVDNNYNNLFQKSRENNNKYNRTIIVNIYKNFAK